MQHRALKPPLRGMSLAAADVLNDTKFVSMHSKAEALNEGVISPEYELIIEPGRAERHYWADLWRYRELFQVLSWRDISVRYKQTVIGAAWAIIRPVLMMVVFTVVFGKLAKLPSEG